MLTRRNRTRRPNLKGRPWPAPATLNLIGDSKNAYHRHIICRAGGETGYISIVELLENGAELDLYFTPKTLAEVQS